jgi:hypothetical protein
LNYKETTDRTDEKTGRSVVVFAGGTTDLFWKKTKRNERNEWEAGWVVEEILADDLGKGDGGEGAHCYL